MNNPQGTIEVEGDKAYIRFRFSPSRFAAIKKVGGAVFDKHRKVWIVPLGNLPSVTSLAEFQPREVEYKFDTQSIAAKIENYTAALSLAYERLQQNPFMVSAGDIELIDPDISFVLGDQGLLRAKLSRKSRAKKLLEALPGVHYIRREQAYSMPARLLNDFLKNLRDRKIRFAVESSAGERLKRGSLLRAHLASRPGTGSRAEMEEALLVPILDAAQNAQHLRLSHWTTEQLRECFPKLHSFAEKKAKAAVLSPREAAHILLLARAKGIDIWLTANARHQLEHYAHASVGQNISDGFEDSILAIAAPEICWTTAVDQSGGLLISQAWLERNAANLGDTRKELLPLPDARFPSHAFIPFRDSKLLASKEALERLLPGVTIPQSLSFQRLVQDLSERERLHRKREHFQALRDAQPQLKNRALASKLFPHQRVAVEWLLQTPHGILGDDMGLGKTLSVLTAVEELKARGELDRFLIICPNSLVRNWSRETAHWIDGLRMLTLPREKNERQRFLKRLAANPQFDGLVVNYETARLDYVAPLLIDIFSRGKSLLCIDESQRVKNSQSKGFKAINEIAQKCGRRVLLTGTPTPKDISDIWGQMMIVDRGERFGTRYYDWLARVAELGNKYSDVAVKRFLPEGVEETIYRVQEVLLRRRKEDVINLPEKLFSTRDVELPPEQLRRYQEVCEELLLRVTKLTGDDYIRSIDSVLEQYLRAVQIASNPRLVDPLWKGEPAKFTELDSIVQEIVLGQRGKIVIWTNYLLNVEELVGRYQLLGAAAFSGQVEASTRQSLVEQFQDPASNLKVLVAVPGAGGVGITLTAAQTAVYLDKTWNAEHWMQSVNRIHRIGQTGTVSIISLHASKVDELIAHNLRRKERMQERLLRGLPADESEIGPSLSELVEALRGESDS